MKETDGLFEIAGREAELISPGGEVIKKYKALIEPLRYKNKMYLDGVYTEIGFNSQGHYKYIGPPDADVSVADGRYIRAGDEKYQIIRAEKVYKGREPFYFWAIIRTISEEEEENG